MVKWEMLPEKLTNGGAQIYGICLYKHVMKMILALLIFVMLLDSRLSGTSGLLKKQIEMKEFIGSLKAIRARKKREMISISHGCTKVCKKYQVREKGVIIYPKAK